MPEDASSLARHREFGFFPPNSWRSKSPQKNCLLAIVMRSSSPVAAVTLATGAKAGPFEDRNRFVGIVIGATLARVGLNEVFGLGSQDGNIVEYDEAGRTIVCKILADLLAQPAR